MFQLLSLLHVPPSQKKIYIPLSLVHLINMAGDNCMRQNACLMSETFVKYIYIIVLFQIQLVPTKM